jgi:nucleotide-binding universal stress UspA family protein
MFEKILVPTDGSEHSLRAAQRAIRLALEFNSTVVIFHAINHHFVPQEIALPFNFLGKARYAIPDYQQLQEEFKKFGEKVLKATKKLFDDAGVVVESRLILDVSPEDYAKDIVKKEKFDVVIVGCKGHHWKLKTATIGTVAEKIMNNVDCDVMIVH